MSRLLHGLAACLLVFALLGAGCGGPRGKGTVSGKITVGGKPLSKGLITFLSQVGNKDSYNAAIVNGEYQTGEIPVGPATIVILPAMRASPNTPPEEAKSGDLIPQGKPGGSKTMDVPEKYHSANTSALQTTIKPGVNDFSTDLVP
jgi:hypothetical protein